MKLRIESQSSIDMLNAPMAGTLDNTYATIENKKTDYVGNMIYENGQLAKILVDGGYYNIPDKMYHLYLTDHLGNNRMVVKQDTRVMQKNHYYPFGMAFAEENIGYQPYKYNGKEQDRSHGLNHYDYSARYYNPDIPRFTTIDPLAELYYNVSPYAYVGNNPIKRIDPTGESWKDLVVGLVVGGVTNVVPGSTGLRNLYTPDDSSHYNNTLKASDQASLAIGGALVIVGSGEMTAGSRTASAGGGIAATGAGAPAGGTVAAVGGSLVLDGAIKVGAGGLLVANSVVNMSAGYNYGANKFDGGKSTENNTSREALRNAKDQNGVPRSQQPDKTTSVPDKNTGQPLKQYEYTNSKGEKVVIRKDNPVTYPDGGKQGSHYNAGKPREQTDKLKQHHNYED